MTHKRKRCSKCKKWWPETSKNFFARSRVDNLVKYQPDCKLCSRSRLRAWYQANKEHVKQKGIKYRRNQRLGVLIAYAGSPPKCECCGETILEFLAIDHVNGNGSRHRSTISSSRSSTRLYTWLRKNKYPEGFQVLCHNCNSAKGFYGICPHKIK